MGKFIDLTGQKFGRLTVLECSGRNKHGSAIWLCRCACGNGKVIHGGSLRNGSSKTCGCSHSELATQLNLVHGKHGTPEYRAWKAMITRCTNPNAANYSYYGGKDVCVCERWRHSFENFYADMGQKPTSKHSLDRIDANGNYEPSNCRWATTGVQRINRRK